MSQPPIIQLLNSNTPQAKDQDALPSQSTYTTVPSSETGKVSIDESGKNTQQRGKRVLRRFGLQFRQDVPLTHTSIHAQSHEDWADSLRPPQARLRSPDPVDTSVNQKYWHPPHQPTGAPNNPKVDRSHTQKTETDEPRKHLGKQHTNQEATYRLIQRNGTFYPLLFQTEIRTMHVLVQKVHNHGEQVTMVEPA